MALIAMAVYDTEENKRTSLTEMTLRGLLNTVSFARHQLVIVDNGSCMPTQALYGDMLGLFPKDRARLICLGENIGTARAINTAWALRQPSEHAVKLDNDVQFHDAGWLDTLEQCVQRDPRIGIVGLKRKDLVESPNAPRYSWQHSELVMLPHHPGERWLIVERVFHVMGTCQLYNANLLDRIGYLTQPGLYGFDDALAAVRCKVAGFYSCFYPHYNIDHPDPGGTSYQTWKEVGAGDRMVAYQDMAQQFVRGELPLYCNVDGVPGVKP